MRTALFDLPSADPASGSLRMVLPPGYELVSVLRQRSTRAVCRAREAASGDRVIIKSLLDRRGGTQPYIIAITANATVQDSQKCMAP